MNLLIAICVIVALLFVNHYLKLVYKYIGLKRVVRAIEISNKWEQAVEVCVSRNEIFWAFKELDDERDFLLGNALYEHYDESF